MSFALSNKYYLIHLFWVFPQSPMLHTRIYFLATLHRVLYRLFQIGISHNRSISLTPLTKLGELGPELVQNCVLKSKTGVQAKNDIKICYFHKGSTKKVQVMSTKSCKQHHQMISCKFQVCFSFKLLAKTILFVDLVAQLTFSGPQFRFILFVDL